MEIDEEDSLTNTRLKKKTNVVDESELEITAMDIERNLRSEEVDENGDFVVAEYDVYLNQKLGSELALFQYPLRPIWIPFDSTQIADIRMKPNQKKMEMDFNIDKATKYYDQESEVDQVRKKFTLTSSNVPLQTNYAVGVLKDGAIHLTPLNHVTQFRPSFTYLDELDSSKKTKKESKKEEEEESIPSHLMEEESPLRLQVQFKRKETAKAAAARKKAEEKQTFEEEPWANLTFLEKTEPESVNMFESLWDGSKKKVAATVPKEKYLNGLNPLPVIEPWIAQAVEMATANEGISMEAIKKMPLDKQVQTLLTHTQVMHFSKLVELATAATKPEEVLVSVEKIALLLRGVWVIRSDIALVDDKRLRATRDFIMVMLYKNEFVKKHELQTIVKLPPDAIEAILNKMCVQTPDGWKLKVPADQDFMAKYPHIVTKFDSLWENRGQTIQEGLFKIISRAETTAKAAVATSTSSAPASGAPAARAPPATSTEDQYGGHSPKEQLEHFFTEMFRKFGVCNMQFLKQHFVNRQQDKHSGNLLGGVTDEMFRETLKSMTDCIQSAHFLARTGNAAVDKFRTVVIALFKQQVSLRKSDVKEACVKELKEDIPQPMYIKILRELATCKGSIWILKTGDGTES